MQDVGQFKNEEDYLTYPSRHNPAQGKLLFVAKAENVYNEAS
jgi:hypothetical protein